MKIWAAVACCRRARAPRLDVTSYATIPAGDSAHGAFVVRQPGTVAGMPVAAYTVASVCSAAGDFELTVHAIDGDRVERGDVLISVTGNARALLAAERVSLNLITMMSGVATATRAWVDALAGNRRPRVRDSRKTIPGTADAAKVRGAHWRRYQSPDVIG